MSALATPLTGTNETAGARRLGDAFATARS